MAVWLEGGTGEEGAGQCRVWRQVPAGPGGDHHRRPAVPGGGAGVYELRAGEGRERELQGQVPGQGQPHYRCDQVRAQLRGDGLLGEGGAEG